MKRSRNFDYKEMTGDRNETEKFAVNPWTNCLYNAIKDESLIVFTDKLITIIKDKYPKSRHHLLVLPTKTSQESVRALTSCDLQLVELMTNKAKEMTQTIDRNLEFRFGFHTNPSLKPLHLHVITQDFDSKYLKTKKHYNSFTTHFFIDSKTVIENLKDYGKVKIKSVEECEQLLKQEISCHFCGLKVVNISKLKTHLLRHYPK